MPLQTMPNPTRKVNLLLLISFLLSGFSCTVQDTVVEESREIAIDRERLLADLEYLSSDELEGRAPGTRGSLLAQEFIEQRFMSLGLGSFGESYRHPFPYRSGSEGEVTGVNLIGFVSGTADQEEYLVVTAHYDHLGTGPDGRIFNGADDNASGSAGVLAAAAWFRENPPENSIIFLLLDAEEKGLIGSYYFADHPVVPLEQIALVVNLDMISHSRENEIYAVGTAHYEFLRPVVEESVRDSPVRVLFGHDGPDGDLDDWTALSDHYPFHLKGIPFIYFGVEDHEYYHTPGDRFEIVEPDFYANTVKMIIGLIRDLDGQLEEIREKSGR